MIDDKTGQIVWHDLFTPDPELSMDVFRRIAGWTYLTEHATDFAWGGGEKDFTLALLEDEAGAGLTDPPAGIESGWVPYVEVPDVDAAASGAIELGGSIVRSPFEVPGVGRNALLRDPVGALIGISLSRHNFPVPRQQFGIEIYVSQAAFPAEFYTGLFNWKITKPHASRRIETIVNLTPGERIALHISGEKSAHPQAIWLPCIRVPDLDRALQIAGTLKAEASTSFESVSTGQHHAIIRGPDGIRACLVDA